MNKLRAIKPKPRGAILAVGLMLLLVISMTAVLAMSGSILQERMTGAVRNEAIADNGAESALRDGERWIWQSFVTNGRELDPRRGNSTSYFRLPEVAVDEIRTFRQSLDWIDFGRPYDGNETAGSNAISSSDYHTMPKVPRFTVEALGEGMSGVDWDPESHREGGAATGTGGSPGKLHYYRITARSTGGTENVVRTSESTFTATY